jgi:2-phospho-L-lactate guanylyltransferase
MSEDLRTWAVIPVKRFSAAKRRLAPVLDASERAELARLMFADVLDVVMSCKHVFAGVLVVTCDHDAATMARSRCAAIVPDQADSGINLAVTQAIRHLAANAEDGIMVVPSDIPQVTRKAFAQAAAALVTPRSLAIAVAVNDGGTNLYACRPADVIAPRFGPRSFDRHRRAALQAGVAVKALQLPEFSLDIDRPEDLRAFLALNSKTRTHGFLSDIPLIKRLEQYGFPNGYPLGCAVAKI